MLDRPINRMFTLSASAVVLVGGFAAEEQEFKRHMEISGRLMKEDLDDVAHLLRPRGYWVSFVLETWRGAALFLTLVWITILGLLGRTKPNWVAMGLIWTVVAGIVLWAARTVRRERTEDLARVNAAVPESSKFTSEGIRWTERDGRAMFLHWSDVTAWRERGRVIAIDQRGGTPAVILSVGNLPEWERRRLWDFLRSQLAAPAPSGRAFDQGLC
jgi:hypothetical protein